MPDRFNPPQARRSQRRHRNRQGVIRVVLVRAARRQQPRPRRERGRHINNRFTGRDELLGEQIAEPARGLDRPCPRRKRRSPRHELGETCAPPARTFFRSSSSSPPLIATAVWVALCGSIPMITVMIPPWSQLVGTAEGTPTYRWSYAFLFRATPRRGPDERLFDRKPTGTSRRQAHRELPRQGPPDATDQPQRLPKVSSRHIGDTASASPARVMGRAFCSGSGADRRARNEGS